MKIRHREFEPKVDASAYIAPTAILIGQVTIGASTRIMYGSILDSEASSICIGKWTIICENAVIRAAAEGGTLHPVKIADHVFIGPHATILGCTLVRFVYAATSATVLQGAKVGAGCVIAVGALVHANAVVPEGTFIPPYNIAIGNPVKIHASDDENLTAAIKSIGFPLTAFGVKPDPADRLAVCRGATEVRSKEFEARIPDEIMASMRTTDILTHQLTEICGAENQLRLERLNDFLLCSGVRDSEVECPREVVTHRKRRQFLCLLRSLKSFQLRLHKFVIAVRTDAMAESCFQVFCDIRLDRLPVIFITTHFLELPQFQEYQLTREEYLKLKTSLASFLDEADPNQKHQFLSTFIRRITVEPNQLVLKHIIPIPPQRKSPDRSQGFSTLTLASPRGFEPLLPT